jgi:HEAT repeat protein
LLDDRTEADLHELAGTALVQIEPPARVTTPALLRCVWDREEPQRGKLVELLSQMAAPKERLIPVWLNLLADPGREVRDKAGKALKWRGQPGIVAVLKGLAGKDAVLRRHAAEWLGDAGERLPNQVIPALAARLEDESLSVRLAAADALLALDPQGPMRAQAVTVLTEAVWHGGDGVRRQALDRLLVRLSGEALRTPDVLGVLREWLRDPDAEVRCKVLNFLADLKPRDLVPLLIEAVQDSDPRVRRLAALHICRCGPAARAAVPALIDALRSKDNDLRKEAAEALGGVGGEDPVLAGLLVQAYRRTRSDLPRKGTVRALASFDKVAAVGIPVLAEHLRDRETSLRFASVVALAAVDPDNPALVPAAAEGVAEDPLFFDRLVGFYHLSGRHWVPDLVAVLGSKNATQRLGATLLLGELRAEGRPAVPRLRQALADEDPRVRLQAARTIWRVTGHNEAAVAVLVELVNGKDPQLRRRAVETVGEWGAAALPAVPTLIECLQSPDENLVEAACDTLHILGARARPALPALLKILQGDNPIRRLHAARGLGGFGRQARAAVPHLLRMLEEAPFPERQVAAWALGKIATAEEAGAALAAALREAAAENDRDALDELTNALYALGPSICDEVVKLLQDGRPQVRSAAVRILGCFGEKARDRLPALLALAADQDGGVRGAVRMAVEAIDPEALVKLK